MPDQRTESQKDRDNRGMVLFNGQEITREAYDRIRGALKTFSTPSEQVPKRNADWVPREETGITGEDN